MMTDLNFSRTSEDGSRGVAVKWTPDFLRRATDEMIDKMAHVLTSAMKRERAQLICEHDGHQSGPAMELGGVCDRCGRVVDESKFEALQTR